MEAATQAKPEGGSEEEAQEDDEDEEESFDFCSNQDFIAKMASCSVDSSFPRTRENPLLEELKEKTVEQSLIPPVYELDQ